MKGKGNSHQSIPVDSKIRREKVGFLAVIVLYLLVTIGYGTVNPLFEAPDEQLHYYTAQLIVESRKLPFIPPHTDYDEWISQEAAQPPLYYIISAALTAPVDSSNVRGEIWPNKYRNSGDASALNNRNHFIHTFSESWPWQGYSLAVHLLRSFSTLLGLGTLLCIYASGRLLWPDDPYRALLAMGLVASIPQFSFLFSSVSNDTLIIFLCAFALWQLIRFWLAGVTRGRMFLLGITIALAVLTKNAGIILFLYSVGVILLLAVRGPSSMRDQKSAPGDKVNGEKAPLSRWRLVGEMVIFLVLPAALATGWLWIRNYALYGDITAVNQFLRFSGGDRNYSLFQVLGESEGLWLSMIAVFGWFNLRPPDWVYWFWNGVVVLATAGALWHRSRRVRVERSANDDYAPAAPWPAKFSHFLQRKWILALLLAGWILLLYLSLLIFMLKTEAAQGRLLFPALVPLALGLAYGWTAAAGLRRFSILLPFISFLITLYCLFFIIQPAYAIPEVVEQLPEEATEIGIEVGDGLTLLGAVVETETAEPGDPVWLTLYWQVDSIPEETPAFTISIFGRDLSEAAKLHSYHGRGLFPASLWSPGTKVADRFAIRLQDEIDVPVLGRIWAGIEDGAAGADVGEVKIVPANWIEASEPGLARIADVIALSKLELDRDQVKAGEMIELSVQWQVISNPIRDLTTLIHMGQPDQTPLAVGDRPPKNGSYPTRVWQTGEVIEDEYSLQIPIDLPAGRYPLWIGMYDSETLFRAPVRVGGERQPRDVYLAGWLELEE